MTVLFPIAASAGIIWLSLHSAYEITKDFGWSAADTVIRFVVFIFVGKVTAVFIFGIWIFWAVLT